MERLTDKRLALPPGVWQEVTHEEARELIKQTPAADVAPGEHGHWNDINPAALKPGISWVCRCSLCGCPQDYKHNYCPNCGARMDKEDT